MRRPADPRFAAAEKVRLGSLDRTHKAAKIAGSCLQAKPSTRLPQVAGRRSVLLTPKRDDIPYQALGQLLSVQSTSLSKTGLLLFAVVLR